MDVDLWRLLAATKAVDSSADLGMVIDSVVPSVAVSSGSGTSCRLLSSSMNRSMRRFIHGGSLDSRGAWTD